MSQPVFKGEKNGTRIYAYRPASRNMTPELEQMERSRDFWEARARHLDEMRRDDFHAKVEAYERYIERVEREAEERRGKRVERMGFAICYTGAIIIFAMYVARFMFG